MTILEEIRLEIEVFLINSIKKMINDSDLNSYYSLEKIKYGDYNIKVNFSDILVSKNNIEFKYPFEDIEYYQKTFFGIKYGKELKKRSPSKIGEIINLFKEERQKIKEVENYKSMIDLLPEEAKKKILRKRKLEMILDDDENDFPDDELRELVY